MQGLRSLFSRGSSLCFPLLGVSTEVLALRYTPFLVVDLTIGGGKYSMRGGIFCTFEPKSDRDV